MVAVCSLYTLSVTDCSLYTLYGGSLQSIYIIW